MQKTVFVIGAGASTEVGLPDGMGLMKRISHLLDIKYEHGYRLTNGDYVIADAIKDYVVQKYGSKSNFNNYLNEAWHVRDAMTLAPSIDNFIDTHRENKRLAFCGKLAIIKAILEAEKNSDLGHIKQDLIPETNFNLLDGSWYLVFFQLLTENCDKEQLKHRLKTVVLIVFNYDRCIEYFMHHALQIYYKITPEEATDIMACLYIYHPYGSVGLLPWADAREGVNFGCDASSKLLLRLANGIKTFAEGTDPESSDVVSIQNHLKEAIRLVFIGFAFDNLNMQLINPRQSGERRLTGVAFYPRCYASTYGFSNSDESFIRNQINQLYGADVDLQVHTAHVKCKEFFTEFRKSLSF